MRRLLSWVLVGTACTATAPYTPPVSSAVPVPRSRAFRGRPRRLRWPAQRHGGRRHAPCRSGRVRQAGGDLHRAGAALQRRLLPRLSREPRGGRSESGHRAPRGAPRRAGQLRLPRRAHRGRLGRRQPPDADQRQGHLPGPGVTRGGCPAAPARLGEHPCAAHLGEHAGRRVRGGGSRRAAGGHRALAVQPARARRVRHCDAGAGSRGAGYGEHRPLRMEGRARERPLLRGRRVPERDGRDDGPAAQGRDAALRHGSGPGGSARTRPA